MKNIKSILIGFLSATCLFLFMGATGLYHNVGTYQAFSGEMEQEWSENEGEWDNEENLRSRTRYTQSHMINTQTGEMYTLYIDGWYKEYDSHIIHK